MNKYHAGKNGRPICSSGRIDGFKTVVVGAKDWNKLGAEHRCAKCVSVIVARKQA